MVVVGNVFGDPPCDGAASSYSFLSCFATCSLEAHGEMSMLPLDPAAALSPCPVGFVMAAAALLVSLVVVT